MLGIPVPMAVFLCLYFFAASIVLHSILFFIFAASFALGHIANSYRDSLLIGKVEAILDKHLDEIQRVYGSTASSRHFSQFFSPSLNGKVQFNDTIGEKCERNSYCAIICLFRSLSYVAHAY